MESGESIQIVRVLSSEAAKISVPETDDEATLRIHLDAGDLAAAIERL
jgi:hypothetical protein